MKFYSIIEFYSIIVCVFLTEPQSFGQIPKSTFLSLQLPVGFCKIREGEMVTCI